MFLFFLQKNVIFSRTIYFFFSFLTQIYSFDIKGTLLCMKQNGVFRYLELFLIDS